MVSFFFKVIWVEIYVTILMNSCKSRWWFEELTKYHFYGVIFFKPLWVETYVTIFMNLYKKQMIICWIGGYHLKKYSHLISCQCLVCSFKTTGPILIKLTSLKDTEKIFKNMIEICTIFKNESIWFQVNRKNHKI